MTSTVTHPLVSAYLRDLELLLHGVDPGERAEVLGGVREHLEASLVPGASDDDVRAVLAELGSAHSVADEAYAGRPGPVAIATQRPPRSPWLAHVACFLNAAFLALVTLLGMGHPHPSELLILPLMGWIPWVCLVVLSSLSDVWSSAEKFASILLAPAAIVAVALTSWISWDLLGWPILGGATTLLVATAGVLVLVRLIRSTRA